MQDIVDTRDRRNRNGILERYVTKTRLQDIVDTTALAALIALVEEIEGHNISVFIAGIPPGLRRFLGIGAIADKLRYAKRTLNYPQDSPILPRQRSACAFAALRHGGGRSTSHCTGTFTINLCAC